MDKKEKSLIPYFKYLKEAADYWDTHSFADHFEETEPVEIKVHLPRHRRPSANLTG